MRIGFQKFSEEQVSFLMSKKILTRADFESLIHGNFCRIGLLKTIISALRGFKHIRLMIHLSKIISKSKKVYRHYKKIPKEYDTRKYHLWLLRSMQLFEEMKVLEPKM